MSAARRKWTRGLLRHALDAARRVIFALRHWRRAVPRGQRTWVISAPPIIERPSPVIRRNVPPGMRDRDVFRRPSLQAEDQIEIVRNHYEPEESLRLGEPMFSIVVRGGWSSLLNLDDFTRWLKDVLGIVRTREEVRRIAEGEQ